MIKLFNNVIDDNRSSFIDDDKKLSFRRFRYGFKKKVNHNLRTFLSIIEKQIKVSIIELLMIHK